jgi:hypothetical protein
MCPPPDVAVTRDGRPEVLQPPQEPPKLMAANIRKIRAWRALTTTSNDRTAQRPRQRRTSLRDYLPDG